ncbi:MAG: hypothetical protein Kow0025_18450 [Thermodesulfovibrionales bacterium]
MGLIVRRGEVETTCPKCSRPSPVTKGAELVSCWKCSMGLSDAVEHEKRKENDSYNWGETIERIREAHDWKQRDVAHSLRLHPNALTAIKRGKRPMPSKALDLIKEKHSQHLVLAGQKQT